MEHYITIGGIISPVVSVAVGAVLTWYLRRVDKKAEGARDAATSAAWSASSAHTAADTAVAQTVNTGNGFATHVTSSLARIEARQLVTDQNVQANTTNVAGLAVRLDAHLKEC